MSSNEPRESTAKEITGKSDIESSLDLTSLPKELNQSYTKRWSIEDIKKFSNQFKHEIGKGASVHVYKGEAYKTPVAIKEYTNPGGGEFFKEIKSLLRCNHPSIISIMGIHEGNPAYLVLEYMSKGSLQDYIEKKYGCIEFKTKEELLMVFVALSQALYYLHENSVIHRDIKPSNIMFDRFGKPKFTEFNLAKINTEDSNTFEASIVAANTSYVDPVLSVRNLYGKFTDIFGIGITMFVAFARTTDPALINRKGKKIFDNLDFEAIKDLFYHNWEDKMAMRLLSYMLSCTDVNHRNRPSAEWLVEKLEEELNKLNFM